MIKNKNILFVFRLFLGGVFICSGILKIIDPLEFAQNISNYRIFSQGLSFLIALILPWVELVCGIFLIVGLFRSASALLLASLLIAFLVLIFTTVLRGIDVECGCFGVLRRKVDYFLILTDALLLYLSLNIFLVDKAPTAQ